MIISKYVIIGASAAAMGAITRLRQLDPGASILVISQEKEVPYNKCLLADYIVGEKGADQLHIVPAAVLADPAITFMTGMRVECLIPENFQIVVADGQKVQYESLLLATGSRPFIPPLFMPFAQAKNLFFFHTLADMNALQEYVETKKSRTAVIIGAGLSGLECADALAKRGITVTLIERHSQILPGLLPADAASFIHDAAMEQGITMCYKKVHAMHGTPEQVSEVLLANGAIISADIFIVATGLQPNSELAQAAGIACEWNSVTVNEYLQTSVPSIYAAGDLIATINQCTKQRMRSVTWPDAMMQGGYAACAMAGQQKVYPGIIPIVSSSFFGVKCAAGGELFNSNHESIKKTGNLSYTRYSIDKAGIVKGFALIGPSISMTHARRALLTQQPLDTHTESAL